MALRFSPSRGAGALTLNSLVRGPTGAAATLTAGTATTLAAGASATVGNSGSTSAAVFDLGVPRGADAGIKWLYATSTAMADPGSGAIRFNNATLASVTAIALNANGSGADVSDFIAAWDDSTNSVKCYLMIREEAANTAAIFRLSAAVDNGAWLQLTVAYVSGALSLAASDPLYIVPLIAGNAGEVSSSGTSNNNEFAMFADGTADVIKSNGLALDVDGTFAANSDVKIPSQKAVKTYADALIAANDAMVFKGVIDCSASPNYPAADRGHTYRVSVAGKIGGASGTNVEIGDILLCLTDGTISGTQAGVGASWSIIQVNLDGAYIAGGTDVAVADGGTGSSTAAGALANLTARGQGKETIFIPAAAMKSRVTNGPSVGSVEQTTNKNMVVSLDFDTTTQEFAQFSVWFPKSWNLGTVTFQPCFSQLTIAAGGVVFGLAGVAVSDTDALDVAFGTAQTSTKTAGTANLEYQGPESAAITIAGTPAAGDRVMFQVNRTVADGSDTLAQDARLHGIRLFFTTNAVTDT